jgi:hypothetical protein
MRTLIENCDKHESNNRTTQPTCIQIVLQVHVLESLWVGALRHRLDLWTALRKVHGITRGQLQLGSGTVRHRLLESVLLSHRQRARLPNRPGRTDADDGIVSYARRVGDEGLHVTPRRLLSRTLRRHHECHLELRKQSTDSYGPAALDLRLTLPTQILHKL